MTKQKIVVALGGNAILSTDASAKAQQEALISTSKSLVKLIKEGHEVIVTHGNGPQVGNLLYNKQRQILKRIRLCLWILVLP